MPLLAGKWHLALQRSADCHLRVEDCAVRGLSIAKKFDDFNERVEALRANVRTHSADIESLGVQARAEKRARLEQDARLGVVESRLDELQKGLNDMRTSIEKVSKQS